jgi:hypothetical protein
VKGHSIGELAMSNTAYSARPSHVAFLAGLAAALSAPWGAQGQDVPTTIAVEPAAGELGQLAAREVRRYVYLRTGQLPAIAATAPLRGDAIVLFVDGEQVAEQEYSLNTEQVDGRRVLLIAGGSEVALLYGAYRFAEHLGVRFYLHGDVIPDGTIADWRVPILDEKHKPLFELRGIQPFHDFTEGPDWWNLDDYRAYLSQLVKLRMNFMGLHCYPEGGVGPEPLVWIGRVGDMDEAGRVTFSYPSRWASTMGGAWGYTSTPTSEFAAGAALLFDRDDCGPAVTEGRRPKPITPDGCNEVFNRAATLFREAFTYGRSRGVRFCVGTETPLTIPQAVRQRLSEQGIDPDDPSTVRMLYEGIFTRIARALPVDYYWLWTPENWTWSGTTAEQIGATVRDVGLALEALENVGQPFKLTTCGWVLGPPGDRTLFDKLLPRDAPVSCINRQVGFDPVEPGFALVEDRPKWAIPWLEDDPALIIPQLWAGRMRRDAADALAYGCTGLLGIHWRTRVLSPNIAALAQAEWDQAAWNPDLGKQAELPQVATHDVHVGGSSADYPQNPIKDTEEDRVYQTCRWNVDAYRLNVPDGTYSVTLKFCETHYREAGKRVFGVRLQGQQVLEQLDVFARVGANTPVDLTFDRIMVSNGELTIEFTREIEYPFIAGIVIEGRTTDAASFSRRVNCGGDAWTAYESDLPAAGSIGGARDRPRDLPAADFYADWAQAQFGDDVAGPLAELFTRLDGGPLQSGGGRAANLPRPANWDHGPGGIIPSRTPWQQERERYAFVDEMAAMRARVVGAGNRARLDYWLNTFRYLRAVGELACARGELDALMEQIGQETNRDVKARIATREALPLRQRLARLWEEMMTLQLAVVSTPGEMGTIANLEQHVRRNREFLTLHDAALLNLLGRPLPGDVAPTLLYLGKPRLIVPTVRGDVKEGESLALRIIVLDNEPPEHLVLHWRELGDGVYHEAMPGHLARGVYTATLPPTRGLALEYYIEAETAGGERLLWPPTAPQRGQTVVVAPR